MRIPARRAVLAVVSAVAATLLVSGGAAASLGAPAATGSAGLAAPAGTGALASTGAPANYVFVHDPSMAREGGTYYLFSTGDPAGTIGNGNIQIRTSRDLRHWTYNGTVFADKPAWITAALGSIPNLWAPDISYFGGLWHLYYAGSSFGSNNSVIGLATTPTLDPRSPRYHWSDDGLVFRSSTTDDYNAIDPSLVSGRIRDQVAGVRVVLERHQARPAGRRRPGSRPAPRRPCTHWPSGPRRTRSKAQASPTTPGTTTCSCRSTRAARASAVPTASWRAVRPASPDPTWIRPARR